MFKFFKAFTLAETLIVMGIIGVVAALTLPNLNSSTGDREKVAKVKKIYQNLNDIHGRMEAVYGPYKEWNCSAYTSKEICYAERMSDFLKVSKTCKTEDECIALGSTGDNIGYLLSDGMLISATSDTKVIWLHVNISNNKINPSVGKDMFTFIVDTDKGVVPNPEHRKNYDYSDCIQHKWGTCTSWVINFGNMDYLKADSNGKCKNSSIVLDGVNNTSCK